ncbi:glycogen debranching protein GlgX [soil metagenome]
MDDDSQPRLWPGRPDPLGATWDGRGANFALYSEAATGVDLCLFDHRDSLHETHRIPLRVCTNDIWHGYLPDILPGQLYGYRVRGPYDPANGLRCNPHKILLDPYARLVGRELTWDNALFGYNIGEDDLSYDERDSAAVAPLGTVVDNAFTWDDDRPLRTPWNRTLIYELHVKGFTKQMSGVPEELRGTYLGLASEAAIEHLHSLNVTAVELLPVHHRVNDRYLFDKGFSNYWGYSTLNFFSPDTRFAKDPAAAVIEFKMMVRRLHQAGIEVILDVVYNHTGEGSELGPTISFRGIDNVAYYRLAPESIRHCYDTTGCGNSPNMQHPRVLQLMADSLRYWVTEMHVDGFRFDLATTLGREPLNYDRFATFFDLVHQDPILSQVKLIAEPWDVGDGGYQVGNFPILWSEWNADYRDTIRRYWIGAGEVVPQFASRVCGSSDIFEHSRRSPRASINILTCHDGFTLADLVSYNEKHNDANCEENRDGHNNNHSCNWGVEGPTDDPAIKTLRLRQQRNMLATLLLSQGVPMLLAGDEIGHTQAGNNNAYCQDNEITWLDWTMTEERQALLTFVKKLTRLRREHPVLRRSKFFKGQPVPGLEIQDISWFRPDGAEMTEADWAGSVKTLGIRLAGDLIQEDDEEGHPVTGDTLYMLFNTGEKTVKAMLPLLPQELRWELCFNTAVDNAPKRLRNGGEKCTLSERSVKLYRTRSAPHPRSEHRPTAS